MEYKLSILLAVLLAIISNHECEADVWSDILDVVDKINPIAYGVSVGLKKGGEELDKKLINAIRNLDYNGLIYRWLKTHDVSKMITNWIDKMHPIDINSKQINVFTEINITNVLISYIMEMDEDKVRYSISKLASYLSDEKTVEKLLNDLDVDKAINSYIQKMDAKKLINDICGFVVQKEMKQYIPVTIDFRTISKYLGESMRSLLEHVDILDIIKSLLKTPGVKQLVKENIKSLFRRSA